MKSDHLNDSERQAYEKQISKLSKASTLEKALLWLILLTVIGMGFFMYKSNLEAQERRTEIVKAIQEQNTAIKNKTDEINRHLDCIVVFFTNAQRQELSIKDIDKCVLQKDDDPAQTFRPLDSDTASGGSMADNPSASGSDPAKPKKPDSNGSGGNKPEEPKQPEQPPQSYSQCITSRQGILGKVTGVITCL